MAYSFGPRPYINTNGLVLNLDAGNTASYPGSGSTWTDLSGNNYNGTLINGPTFSSANGGSIVFDGSDDYVDVNYSGNPQYFTIEVVVKPITLASTQIYVGKYQSNSNSWWIGLAGSFYFAINSFQDINTGATPLSTSNYYFLTGVVGSTQQSFYMNGTLVGTNTAISTSPAANLLIGRYNSSFYPNANIAAVKLYSRELSAKEVFQNYYALKGRFGL